MRARRKDCWAWYSGFEAVSDVILRGVERHVKECEAHHLSSSTRYTSSMSSTMLGPNPKVNSAFHCGAIEFMMTPVWNDCPLLLLIT